MAKKIREFMTHREPPEHIWVERDESAVIGTARMGPRLISRINAFDLLRNVPHWGNRSQGLKKATRVRPRIELSCIKSTLKVGEVFSLRIMPGFPTSYSGLSREK